MLRKGYERICCTWTKMLFLLNDGNNDKKAKRTKKWVIKRRLKFNDCENRLLNIEIIFKSQ